MAVKFVILVIYFILISSECRSLTNEEQEMEKNILPTWKFLKQMLTDSSKTTSNYKANQYLGKIISKIPNNKKFFCETSGYRSPKRPNSVNKLRPGDIDIIAAMGDSLTSGNGIIAEYFYQPLIENRGISWSIGGIDTWRKYWTLPNFLKEYNPNLYGYSIKDGVSTNRGSRFNVAEPMTTSSDMYYQAKVLLQRMKNDKNVNMLKDWKLLTIFIGSNDFCQNICYSDNPENILQLHKNDMIKTIRFLRDNIPRLIINWIPAANVIENSKDMTNLPTVCRLAQIVECDCVFRSDLTKIKYNLYKDINKKWQQLDKDIVNLDEFHTKNFTVNYQPFSVNASVKKQNGQTDYRFLSTDCFHFSQLGHAAMANAIWNNMLQPENKKQHEIYKNFKHFECPSNDHPYLVTRENNWNS